MIFRILVVYLQKIQTLYTPMATQDKRRIEYIDFIKTFAMFIVTIGHCAQSLSGEVFPDRIIPKELFISVHMPLFMIASGFLLNIDKIRGCKLAEYTIDKFKRLIIPLITYYAIWCIVTMSSPSKIGFFMIYWYLFALFICLITIKLLTIKIQSNSIVLICATILILAIPCCNISHINFMFPFLVFGYILRRIIDRADTLSLILLGVAYILLYSIWGIQHTVYISPLRINHIDLSMLYSFTLRLLIGITGSTFIFILAKKLNESPFIKWGAKFGKYTIGFYTITTILNAITHNTLNHIDFHITQPIILEISAWMFTFVQMFIIYKLSKVFEKNRILSFIFLGEGKKL